MSQHDLTIDNQGFPAFRADLNNALQALGSTQSGTSAPSPTFANQLWYDTTNNQLKIRNEDNDAWITLLTLDQSADTVSQLSAAIVALAAGSAGTPSLTASGDTNTGLFFPTADTVGFSNGGTERLRINANGYLKVSDTGNYYGSTGSYHEIVTNSAGSNALRILQNNSSFNDSILRVASNRNTTNTSYYFMDCIDSGFATKFSVADSGSIRTSGSIALGGTLTPTSGVGVRFPATQDASSDANTLDDYEEGTWTPVPTFGGGNTGMSYSSSGTYTKIGRLVHVYGTFSITSNGSSTGTLRVTGLPFTSGTNQVNTGTLFGDGWNFTGAGLNCGIESGTPTQVTMVNQTGGTGSVGGWAYLNQSNVSNGSKFFDITYFV